MDEPSLIPWAPDSIEAHARAGQIADARRVLALFQRQAEQTGTQWAAAALERCRGIIVDDNFEPHFAAALGLHDGLPMPFERGRTLLAYGERLHRARRRMEARKPLREALDLFEGMGAAPWVARARAELSAAGGIRRRPSVHPDALTEQEARVATVVAAGATNQEVAAQLFLSEKTVEYHLGHIFRKLGINRRAQLAAMAARDGIAPGR